MVDKSVKADAILGAFRKRVPFVVCPVCHTGDFQLADEVFALVPASLTLGSLLPSRALPVVSLQCSKCTHLMFFGARALGVASAEPVVDIRFMDTTDQGGGLT